MRQSCNYYTPDDVYEALVAGLVCTGISWLDVGCGRELFPSKGSITIAQYTLLLKYWEKSRMGFGGFESNLILFGAAGTGW